VRTNLERLRSVRRLLDQDEDLSRGRMDRMADLSADTKEKMTGEHHRRPHGYAGAYDADPS
jgi:hypothetical protein